MRTGDRGSGRGAGAVAVAFCGRVGRRIGVESVEPEPESDGEPVDGEAAPDAPDAASETGATP